jgi:spoIIIJ-associated protein
MKDQIFTGRTVTEAVEIAGRTLGLAPDAIRYVILERETSGVMGVGGTSARIAVLLERTGSPQTPGPRGQQTPSAAPERSERPKEPLAAIRAFVREFAETSGFDLTAEVEEDEQRTVVRLFGADTKLLLENGAEVLIALDHVVQRAFGRDVHPRRLVLDCEGYREARDGALEARARELAQAVRADGKARETEPLNAYERRIVHMVVGDEKGLRTFSVGEGQDRRVTIALQEAEGGGGDDKGSA